MSICVTLPYMLANLSWKDVQRAIERNKLVLLLPLGSTESHGPHAPLSTDITISKESCLRAAKRLQQEGYDAWVLPSVSYAVTECARNFPGTISISPQVETQLIADICLALIRKRMRKICLFNSHFEPAHLKCIYDAIDKVEDKTDVRVWFTDITKKKYSTHLTEAFQKGETHADRYETSIVMAVDPSLVHEEIRISLPYLPINLVDKLFKENLDEFCDFGMPDSYCGDPAAATAEEGEEILELLSGFLVNDIKALFRGETDDRGRGLYGRDY